jgi:hypothetical protein
LTPPRPPSDAVSRYWFDRFEPTDARAAEYAARYRSAYVWQFVLGTLAVAFGAVALVLNMANPAAAELREAFIRLTSIFAFLELAVLIGIVALVLLGTRRDWHERSIEYRLLAELCRKQQALAPLGWALPVASVQRPSMSDRPTRDRADWVGWLFAAEQRAAPLPRGELATAAKGAPRGAVLDELIAEQRLYHTGRAKMADAAGRTLERWGEILFGAVIVSVIVKIALADIWEAPDWAVPFGLFATVLPAVSAAFFGIRTYGELGLLAEQSHHMAAELERAHSRVERLNTDRPLVSQDIGQEAASVAALMLQDLEGWAQLFRVKGAELP